MDISVVICTYSRANLLKALFDSLACMGIPAGCAWEVVVVDNNSRDATTDVVRGLKNTLPLVYGFEKAQGKTHALNRGLEMASGRIFLFVDDDVVVAPNWLDDFVTATREQPAFSWFGGRVKPDWEGNIPHWFREETAPALSGYFGDYDLGETSRPYESGDKLPLGASLAVRREVFDRVGEFRVDLGPRGSLRGVGDETEMLDRAQRSGFRGYYVGGTRVLHHVGKDRRTLSGFWNYGVGKGLNQYRMEAESKPGSLLTAGTYVLRGAVQVAKGRGDRARLCVINAGMELGRLKAAKSQEPY